MAERLAGLDIRPGQRYLEIGCGTGAAAIHVACAYGLHVTGVDIDPEQVGMAETAARGLGGVTFRQADATCLPFPDACFDAAAMNKTTHHTPGWGAALAEMTRVVRPGGYVLCADLTVPGWMTPMPSCLSDARLACSLATTSTSAFANSDCGWSGRLPRGDSMRRCFAERRRRHDGCPSVAIHSSGARLSSPPVPRHVRGVPSTEGGRRSTASPSFSDTAPSRSLKLSVTTHAG